VRAQLRTSTRQPFARLEYRGQWRQYKASEQWNRDTHTFQATLDRRLGPLQFEGIGSWQIASQTEDREIADVYSVSPRLGLHFGSARLRAYGRYWARRFEQGSGQEEVIRTGGADLQLEVFSFMEWQAAIATKSPSRTVHPAATCGRPLPQRSAWTWGLTRLSSWRGPGGEELPRTSRGCRGREAPTEEIRWTPAVYIQQGSSQGPELRIGHEYQLRTSNDPRREFDAHRTVLSLRVPGLQLGPSTWLLTGCEAGEHPSRLRPRWARRMGRLCRRAAGSDGLYLIRHLLQRGGRGRADPPLSSLGLGSFHPAFRLGPRGGSASPLISAFGTKLADIGNDFNCLGAHRPDAGPTGRTEPAGARMAPHPLSATRGVIPSLRPSRELTGGHVIKTIQGIRVRP
jgi:hypothetical protein